MMEEVQDLLSDYEELKGESEADVFFDGLTHNLETQKCVLNFLSSGARLSGEGSSVLDSRIFELLFYCYRKCSKKLIVIQYVPSLVFLYSVEVEEKGEGASASASATQKLETLLLTLYNSNLELLSQEFRLPVLTQSSIFHDASRIEVNEMRAWKMASPSITTPQPIVIQRITAQNRQRVIAFLYRLFNHHLGDYPKFILKSFCNLSITLLQKGYPKRPTSSNFRLPSISRIRLSGPGLLELLYGGYFCFYNNLQRLGSQLVDCVHFRGVADANPGVLSAAVAAQSLLMSQGAQSVSVSTPTFSQIAKNMITNASFRTKKMGDDIPVVDSDAPSSLPNDVSGSSLNTTTVVINSQNSNGNINGNQALASISEENGGVSGTSFIVNKFDDETNSGKIHPINACVDLKEKIISKLPLKKKNRSCESNNNNDGIVSIKVAFSNNNNTSNNSGTSSTPTTNTTTSITTTCSTIIPLSQPLSLNNYSSTSDKNKLEMLLLKKKQPHYSNNGELIEIESLEQVEELIKKKNLPTETISIHSPESGTTLF
ncbi:uncharacterized protein Hyccin [Lepeophtheirus salmonis]|uniref:uncharacterized protein Hyccin n=1 Tax=Lepeophtheirus salmonis TaxID=72036 RepID=UPI001AE290F0|nr:uncharacterized protein LOC121125209 [Lepeophtheirus salmonis]